MTAVARVFPRDWDGHRFLRFLTGLALLALALAPLRTPARVSLPVVVFAVAVIAVLTGVVLRVRAGRGPPTL
ncbi:hypothetical protein [Actinoplanes solisilvae]|uniref:hypothetical protein n=1 Tax=Actinoplanes solisilvae TaxID=2486853 RepID=UPI000FDC4FA7|nr:hypothetical protein [Actinoplanes solisilvae]